MTGPHVIESVLLDTVYGIIAMNIRLIVFA